MNTPIFIDGQKVEADKSTEDRLLRLVAERMAESVNGVTRVHIDKDWAVQLYRFAVYGTARDGREWVCTHAVSEQIVDALDDTQLLGVMLAEDIKAKIGELFLAQVGGE